MSKRMRRMAAIAMAAAMAVSTPVAASSGTSGASFSGTTSGTKAHVFFKENVTTIIVPTTLTVAFNPQGLEVDPGNLGTAGKPVTDQVVSRAVAIVSEAIDDYRIGVSFSVSSSGSSKINFVTSEEDLYKEQANKSDYNVLLQLASADESEIKVFSAAGSGADLKQIGVSSGALTVSKEQLSRAKITTASSATGGIVPLTSGSSRADFVLGKAKYKYDPIVLEGYSGTNVISGTLSAIGSATNKNDIAKRTFAGVVGFKFTGKLNEYAKWSLLDENQKITITPTYSCEKAEVNKKNQITETVLSGTGSFLGLQKTGKVSYNNGELQIFKTSTSEPFAAGETPTYIRVGGVKVPSTYISWEGDEETDVPYVVNIEDFQTYYCQQAGVEANEDDEYVMPAGTYPVVYVLDGVMYSDTFTK